MTQPSELRGAILGRGYRLGESVGHVDDALFEATHDRIPGRFRLRLFPVEALANPLGAVRIHRAIRVASLLREPRAVQILDFSVSGDMPPFVVLERGDTESLEEVLSQAQLQRETLSLSRVVEIVESVSIALEASHRMGLIHGDLRPAMILLPRSGSPAARVVGFGWSKELRQAAVAPATSFYLAPEQHAGSTFAVDERADQFSLAVIAYEMLSGGLPFSPEDVAPQPWTSDAEPVPAPLAGMIEEIPPGVDEVLRRAFSFQPARRFRGIREFATQLGVASFGRAESTRGAVARAQSPERVGDSGAVRALQRDAVVEFAASDIPDEMPPEPTLPVPKTAADLEDEGLVLGQAAAAPLSPVDDGKTQISRSPFFEPGPDENLDDPAAHPRAIAGADSDEQEEEAPPARPHRPLSPPTGTPRAVPLTLPGSKVTPADGTRGGTGSQRHRTASEAPPALAGRTRGQGQATGLGKWIAGAVAVLVVSTSAWFLTRDRHSQADHSLPTAVPATAAKVSAPVLKPLVVPAAEPARDDRMEGPLPAPPTPKPTPTVTAVAPPLVVADVPALPAPINDNRPAATAPPSPLPRPDSSPRSVAAEVSGAPPASPACLIRVLANPSAEIWLDNQDTGKRTPLDGYKIPCGTHKLVLKRLDQNIEQMEMIDVKRGQPFRRTYDLE